MPDDHSHASELFAARQAADADHIRYPVEAAFTPPGPYATTTSTVTDVAGNAIYDIYFPANYAALGFQSPIVTWGNGTDDIPPQYTTLLSHLASYGFSVIGTTSRTTVERLLRKAVHLPERAGFQVRSVAHAWVRRTRM